MAGQKLLLVDWKTVFGLDEQYFNYGQADMVNDWTNYSKLQFGRISAWCLVMFMVCPSICKGDLSSRDEVCIKKKLPPWKKHHKYIFDILMVTYGSGDL